MAFRRLNLILTDMQKDYQSRFFSSKGILRRKVSFKTNFDIISSNGS